MKKMQYNVVERDTINASGKAKKDVTVILEECGCEKMYNPSRIRFIRVVQQLVAISILKMNTLLFVQYPANIEFCYKYLRRFIEVKKIAIIHDLESLRNLKTVEQEITTLSMFDVIISHNHMMTKYLRDSGLKNQILDLNIFDYLLDDSIHPQQVHDKGIITFAGNLNKSKFLFHLPKILDIKFFIYGAKIDGIEELDSYTNISYKGSYTSESLIENLEGGWGLVWDGDSLETCDGITGDYMRYNCPHKVSMCIVSEKPIIIWSQAAMAEYITEKRIGIKVDSLNDLPSMINAVTENDYSEMIINVRKERERLIHGQSLKEAIKKISI